MAMRDLTCAMGPGRLRSALLGFAAILPCEAYAQQAGTPAPPMPAARVAEEPASDPALQQAPDGGIADIVVTARRSSESAQRVPIAITTVTAQNLTQLTVRDIIDIQKVAPGLTISSQNTGARAKLTIRGQSEADSRLTTDSSVGIYVDGVNLLRDYGLRSSLVDIAQIEVLKGPQGTLFGKNTTGGALNITTQHPVYEWGGYVDLVYGSYNNAQALAVLNAPLVDDRLALRLVGQVITREGYGRQGNGQDVGDDNVWTGRALLRADPTDAVHILLSGDYVRQRNNGTNTILTNDSMLQNQNSATGALGAIAKQLGLNPASAADRLTAYQAWRVYYDRYRSGSFYDGFSVPPPDAPSSYDDIDHYGFSGTLEVELAWAKLKSISSYRRLIRTNSVDNDATPFDLLSPYPTTHQRNLSQELQLSAIDGAGLDWQLGLFWNRETGNENSVSNNNNYVNTTRAVVTEGDIENSSKAAYGQAVYHFTSRFRMTGGIRYTSDKRVLDSKNRVDPTLAFSPILAFTPGRCNLLTPALGGRSIRTAPIACRRRRAR
ncbi:hypothetical protein FIL70_08540 [Sphingobium fuliginis ATCC 27551]|uniref:TonB-dependent receptor n=2 Tax=Sphingobium fuliginis (strain ATCC 27551) TaxID=336203 RepID=A0A5B8CGY5_SPHSA|nr:hypothetical protein FIL70_08540 [Sphingobium fuliginis ATCC 27551]